MTLGTSDVPLYDKGLSRPMCVGLFGHPRLTLETRLICWSLIAPSLNQSLRPLHMLLHPLFGGELLLSLFRKNAK